MASSHAEIFGSLRTPVLDALAASRTSIDDAFGALGEALIREQFTTVLDHMQRYLASPSPALLQHSVATWTASLLGLGLSPRSVLRTFVSLGDLIVQESKNELPPHPESNLFVRDVVRLNFNTAREVVALFNDELESKRESSSRAHRANT